MTAINVTADPRWEPGSLSTITLDRILIDALADLWAQCWRRDQPADHQHAMFTARIDRLTAIAIGDQATEPCGFCHGQPVQDAGEWADGKPRDPAPCPRCGIKTPLPISPDAFGPLDPGDPQCDADRPF